MKAVLILGIIALSVLGFFIFLMYISKQGTKKPIEQVKEKDKNEAIFIKQRQALYKETSGQREVEVVTPLKEENRGALFEKAIQRKRNNYRDDDEEYEARKKEKEEREAKEELERITKNQERRFEPKPMPFSLTKKEEEEEDKKEELSKEKDFSSTVITSPIETQQQEHIQEEEEAQEDDNNLPKEWELEEEPLSTSPAPPTPIKEEEPLKPLKLNIEPTPLQEDVEEDKKEANQQEEPHKPIPTITPAISTEESQRPAERLFRNDARNKERIFRNAPQQAPAPQELSLEERKRNIEQYELEKRLEFEKFVKEILAEAEDINRRREAFINASYSMSS